MRSKRALNETMSAVRPQAKLLTSQVAEWFERWTVKMSTLIEKSDKRARKVSPIGVGNAKVADYYDETPYQSYPFPQSTPEHLEAVASLFGLNSPAIATATVLELGCASGGNLLPFAARNPEATTVGVDLSKVHIEQANAVLKRMELTNVRFEQKDLSDITASFGTFDYIICHGVYSWVPEEVQEAIHRIARECLSKTGICYISYNTYPGWKAREIVRDAMLFRGGDRESADRLRFARGMIDFMHKVARPASALKVALDEIKPLIDKSAPYYLLHDFLEPYNIPVYFNRFMERANTGKMAYLAEAAVAPMFASNYGSDIAEPLLKECSTQVVLEQYLDFISNRPFRQTLLVHEDQAAHIRYQLESKRLENLSFAGFFEIRKDLREKDDPAARRYYNSLVGPIHITGLAGHAIASALEDAWPATLSFDALLNSLVKTTALEREQCRMALQGFVEEGVIKGYVRFRKTGVNCAAGGKDADKQVPQISKELRRILMTTSSQQDISVWNAWHEPVNLTSFEVLVGRHLDGKRSQNTLVNAVRKLIERHRKSPQSELKWITDLDAIETELDARIEAVIQNYRRKALLINAQS